jgi:hypothetical protein
MSREADVKRARLFLAERWCLSAGDEESRAAVADLIAEVRAETLEEAADAVEASARPDRRISPVRALIDGALYTAAADVRALKDKP